MKSSLNLEIQLTMTKIYKGYSPFIYQLKVHTAMNDSYRSGKIFTIKAKRQVGKSFLAENELLRFAINYPGSVNCIVEPTLGQSRKVFKELVQAVIDSDILRRKNETLLELEFNNGSSILFRSGEQMDSLRGFSVSGLLVLDEAAYLKDEVFEIIKPTTDVWNAPILIISTPRFREGFFYECFKKGFDGNFSKYYQSFDWALEDTSMLLSEDKLEMYRLTTSKNKFRTEYLGEFADDDGCLFNNIANCIIDKKPEYHNLYIGVDWATGSGKDYTCITALNENGQMVFIKYFNDKTPTEQVDLLTNIFTEYQGFIKIVQVEQNSIGSVFYDILVKRNPKLRIVKFLTTNKSKAAIVNKLQAALENEKIGILKDDKLLNELRLYEASYNPKTGNVSYNAPSGFNDDTCISLMLAYDALNTNKGTYNIAIK